MQGGSAVPDFSEQALAHSTPAEMTSVKYRFRFLYLNDAVDVMDAFVLADRMLWHGDQAGTGRYTPASALYGRIVLHDLADLLAAPACGNSTLNAASLDFDDEEQRLWQNAHSKRK
jgi:hypothetical protein